MFALYDFTSSGLTHVNEEYPKVPNAYRLKGPVVDLNFGLVEIDWNATPSPLISFQILGVDSDLHLKHGISLEDLSVSRDPAPYEGTKK